MLLMGFSRGLGNGWKRRRIELDVRSVSKKVGVEPSNTSRAGVGAALNPGFHASSAVRGSMGTMDEAGDRSSTQS